MPASESKRWSRCAPPRRRILKTTCNGISQRGCCAEPAMFKAFNQMTHMALNHAPPTAAQLKRSRELRELRNGGPRGAVAFEMLKKQLEAAFTLEGFAGVIKQ